MLSLLILLTGCQAQTTAGESENKQIEQASQKESRDTQLITSAEKGDTTAVRSLLQQGADVDAQDERGRTAIMAATHGNHPETVKVLIDAGADINRQDNIQDNPFLYAGATGRLEILRLMIDAGADTKLLNRSDPCLRACSRRGRHRTLDSNGRGCQPYQSFGLDCPAGGHHSG